MIHSSSSGMTSQSEIEYTLWLSGAVSTCPSSQSTDRASTQSGDRASSQSDDQASPLRPADCVHGVKCQFRTKCGFSHPDSHQRIWQLMTEADPLAKSQPCRHFERGFCELSLSQCRFAHGESDAWCRTCGAVGHYVNQCLCVKRVVDVKPYRVAACRFYMRGYCELGEACSFAHGKNQIACIVCRQLGHAVRDCKYAKGKTKFRKSNSMLNFCPY